MYPTYFPVSGFIEILYILNCKNLSVTLFSIKAYPKHDCFLYFAHNLTSVKEMQRGRGKQPPSPDTKIPKRKLFEKKNFGENFIFDI